MKPLSKIFEKIDREKIITPVVATWSKIGGNRARVFKTGTGGSPPTRASDPSRTRARGLALALVMVLSMVALGAGGLGMTGAVPSGMVGVPGDNIDADIPACDNPGQGEGPSGNPFCEAAEDLVDAGVYTSEHPDTLEVTVTTPGQAEQHTGATIDGNGPLALVLTDDENSDAREVSISAEVLADIMGYKPRAVFGTYEDGEEWSSEIDYSGEYATFTVPHFSTQTVTFSGSISLFGEPAAHGDTFEYELDSDDGVDNFEIELTGVENTQTEFFEDRMANGDTESIDIGGTTSTVDAELTITGDSMTSQTWTESGTTDGSGSESFSVDGNVDPIGPDGSTPVITMTPEDVVFDDSLRESKDDGDFGVGQDEADYHIEFDSIRDVSEVELSITVTDLDTDDGTRSMWVEVYYAEGDVGSNVFDDPDHSMTSDSCTGSPTMCTVEPDLSIGDSAVSDATLGFRLQSEDDEHERFEEIQADFVGPADFNIDVSSNDDTVSTNSEGTYEIELEAGSETIDFSGNSEGDVDWELEYREQHVTEDPSATIDGQTADHTGILEDGETVTESITLDPGAEDLDVTTTHHEVDVELDWTEVSETVDPVVEVNGHETDYEGTIAEGTTETLTTDTDWVQEGTNRINVTLADANDGPTPQVEFEYSHDADAASKTVEYESETWSQRYEVSNQWASTQEEATVEFPMASNVVNIRSIEVMTNESEWSDVSEEDYTLVGTDLTVELGDIDPDTRKDVRVNASKVDVSGGEIQVTDPTTEGEILETAFEITNVTGEYVGIDVTETMPGESVHYLSESSWDGSDVYAHITSAGSQEVRLIDGQEGSTATVTEAPIEVDPDAGTAHVQIDDADEPRFTLEETVSDADITWTEATSGQQYALVSKPGDDVVDTDTASSPITLTAPGDGTYVIEIYEESSGTTAAPSEPEPEGLPVPGGIWRILLVVTGVASAVVLARFVTRDDPMPATDRTISVGDREFELPTIIETDDFLDRVVIIGMLLIGLLLVLQFGATLGVAAVGSATASQFATIALGIGLILGIRELDRRTTATIPNWMMGLTAGIAVIWILETMQPGVLLGGLSDGFDTIAPLFWFALVGGGAWMAWNYFRGADEPDAVVRVDAGDDP